MPEDTSISPLHPQALLKFPCPGDQRATNTADQGRKGREPHTVMRHSSHDVHGTRELPSGAIPPQQQEVSTAVQPHAAQLHLGHNGFERIGAAAICGHQPQDAVVDGRVCAHASLRS